MKKNGFTLIELLAVIVILAIIALIAVPIVLGIIEYSKDSANKRSVELYANVQNGNTSAYNVGDTKEVTLTGDVAGTYTVRIANMSTPEECNTEGFSQTACGFVIEFEDIITTHKMNLTSTNSGGWLRSAISCNTNYFHRVDSNGDSGSNSAKYTAGVAVAFRIGYLEVKNECPKI